MQNHHRSLHMVGLGPLLAASFLHSLFFFRDEQQHHLDFRWSCCARCLVGFIGGLDDDDDDRNKKKRWSRAWVGHEKKECFRHSSMLLLSAWSSCRWSPLQVVVAMLVSISSSHSKLQTRNILEMILKVSAAQANRKIHHSLSLSLSYTSRHFFIIMLLFLLAIAFKRVRVLFTAAPADAESDDFSHYFIACLFWWWCATSKHAATLALQHACNINDDAENFLIIRRLRHPESHTRYQQRLSIKNTLKTCEIFMFYPLGNKPEFFVAVARCHRWVAYICGLIEMSSIWLMQASHALCCAYKEKMKAKKKSWISSVVYHVFGYRCELIQSFFFIHSMLNFTSECARMT